MFGRIVSVLGDVWVRAGLGLVGLTSICRKLQQIKQEWAGISRPGFGPYWVGSLGRLGTGWTGFGLPDKYLS